MKTLIAALFLFVLHPLAALAQYNVKTYGAKGDGSTLDTKSIQDAIDKAFVDGGGKVIVPAGIYKIGTLILKDKVNLHVAEGATLLGSADYKDYIAVNQKFDSRTKDLYAKYFMIFAEGAKDISITGAGIIHGNGLTNFQEVRPQNLRPYMIRLVDCTNVSLTDIQLLEAANWTLHLLGCKDVRIDGILIKNRGEGNRDGLDIDACQRVSVANSRFSTTDDAIVMKATTNVPCQDITITNCLFWDIGGSALKTGTESNGGFKNITINNCAIRDIEHHAGIELMTVDGGLMQNILLENITMDNVATPFFIRLGLRARPYKNGQYVKSIGEVSDISLNNISAINAKLPSSIIGLHSKKIKNVTVNNYTVRYAETQAATLPGEVTFQEFDYPAANVFKELPAYALYCRSVDGLNLHNITAYATANEKRAAFTFDRVNNLELFAVKADVKEKTTPMINLVSTHDVIASNCRTMGFNVTIFKAQDATVSGLQFSNNSVKRDQKEIIREKGVEDNRIFDDFDTEIKHSIGNGETIKGFPAHDLKNPLKVSLSGKKGVLQLCLLMLNEGKKPENVVLKYDGITQEFKVNWNEWGWAPISLLKEYDANKPINFEILPGDKDSKLKIAKVYLRYQDIAFTD